MFIVCLFYNNNINNNNSNNNKAVSFFYERTKHSYIYMNILTKNKQENKKRKMKSTLISSLDQTFSLTKQNSLISHSL